MAVKQKVEDRHGLFFVTFTCYQWLSLFSITNSYDLVYHWFDVLLKKNHQIAGYVIMPNHVHALIGLQESKQTINTILSNGKRFIAYQLIERLVRGNFNNILYILGEGVSEAERKKGQRHKVFIPSSDVKVCYSDWFTEQKLDYIHNNPCSKKWNLVNDPIDYRHSSMRFYSMYGHRKMVSKLTPYFELFEQIGNRQSS